MHVRASFIFWFFPPKKKIFHVLCALVFKIHGNYGVVLDELG